MDRTFKLTGTAVIAAAAWMTATTLAGQAIVGVPGNRQPRPPSAARIAPLPEAEWSAEQRELAKAAADPAVRTLYDCRRSSRPSRRTPLISRRSPRSHHASGTC